MLLQLFLYLGTSSVSVSRTHWCYFLLCWKGRLLPRIIFYFFDLFFSPCKPPRCTRGLHCFGDLCRMPSLPSHKSKDALTAASVERDTLPLASCRNLLMTMSGPVALNHTPSEINAAYKERQTGSLSTRMVWGRHWVWNPFWSPLFSLLGQQLFI